MSQTPFKIEIIERKQPGCTPHISFALITPSVCLPIDSKEDLILLRRLLHEALEDAVPANLKQNKEYLTSAWFAQERARLTFLEEYEKICTLNCIEKAIKELKKLKKEQRQ